MIKDEQGYSLIIAVVVVGVVLLSLSLAVVRGVIGRHYSDILFEDFSQNYILAESCADVALLYRKVDPNYAGDEVIAISPFSCRILPIIESNPIRIEVESTGEDQVYRIRIEVDESAGFDVVSWQRVAEF